MKKILTALIVFVLIAAPAAYSHPGGGEVIIPPDPIFGGPGEDEDTDAPLQIGVSIHPETLNLSSRGRFVTAYLKVSEDDYSVYDIDRASIEVAKVAGSAVNPIDVLDRPWGYEDSDGDGEEELMVKFDGEEFRGLMPEGEEILVTLQGLFNDGREFYANNAIRTIHKYSYSGERKNFNYNLQKNVPSGASIERAVIWLNYSFGSGDRLLRAGRGQGWNDKFGVEAEYHFLPAGSGRGYKWEVSEEVIEAWENGQELVGFDIDYDPNSGDDYPHMIVKYNSNADSGAGKAMGPKFVMPREKSFIDLYYRPEDVGPGEKVAVFGLNSFRQWEEVTGASIDEREGKATASGSAYSQFQVMSVSSSSSEPSARKASLGRNFPNPFNPSTTIEYAIPEDAHVTLRIYNSRGQRVATVVDEFKRAGSHRAKFTGGDRMPPGRYYYQLRAGSFSATERMAISR